MITPTIQELIDALCLLNNFEKHTIVLGGEQGTFGFEHVLEVGGARLVLNARKLGGYGLVNLFAHYKLDRNWQLEARANNLFDKDYAEHLNLAGNAGFGYPADPVAIDEPGRTLWTKVEFDF